MRSSRCERQRTESWAITAIWFSLWKLTGGKYLTRKPENIIAEISQIQEKYVFFADDESLVDANRMKKLAELIKEAGIKKKYFLYGRSDTIVKHPDLIKIWKDIGLERVFVDNGLIWVHGISRFCAVVTHNPWMLFFFCFFAWFSQFRYLKEEFKYLGLLGLIGLVFGILGVTGYLKV